MVERLTEWEYKFLLNIARDAIDRRINNKPQIVQELVEDLSPALLAPGASFVTLTKHGQLRGCVGALEPRLPLYRDIYEHAVAAATMDYRFPPVQPNELDHIQIEISRLTVPEKLEYKDPDDLITKLIPFRDGVVIHHGTKRATFLPQVWKKIPDPNLFLDHLCQKLGCEAGIWKCTHLDVFVYQVEEFNECDFIQSEVRKT